VNRVDNGLTVAARAMALVGGGLLLGLAGLTAISVLGRYLLAMPVPGDFEIVELGGAVALFLMLPYCQLLRGHVVVDAFSQALSPPWQQRLDRFWTLGFAVLAAVLAWRMGAGGLGLRAAGEETMILGAPRWLAFPPILMALAVLTAVCLRQAWGGLPAVKAQS